VPLSIRLVLGALELCMGLGLLVVAGLGAGRRLPQNRWLGVRTAATMRSAEAFQVANRVAAVPLGAAGAVAAVGGAMLLAGADGPLAWVVLVISVLGSLVLAGVGGSAGDRAAAAVSRPTATADGCAGQCAGCSLVEGCRPAG
jgi:hypothetical protein